jgi:hypothetical protein
LITNIAKNRENEKLRFYGLRNGQIILDICHDMEKLCPDASRINYTNPMSIISWAVRPHKLRAIAEYNVIGYFGEIRTLLGKDGNSDPESETQRNICQCIAAVLPLLLKYQGTDKGRSVIEDDDLPKQLFDFDGYMGLVQYGPLMYFLVREKRGGRPAPGAED